MAPDQVAQAPSRQAGAAAERVPSAFSNPNFVKLWAGQSVSLIGTQVTQFTMPLIAILSLNATVAEVGVLNALRFVPVVMLSLFAGVWLDRRRRRPVLIACALGNAVLIGVGAAGIGDRPFVYRPVVRGCHDDWAAVDDIRRRGDVIRAQPG